MRIWLVIAALNGFISVAAGAFGAHALKSRLSADLLATFETGARYQMFHALALIGVAWLASIRPGPLTTGAGIAFTVGIVLFTGSLYTLALSGIRAFGAVTPFGGLGFLTGWALLVVAALRG